MKYSIKILLFALMTVTCSTGFSKFDTDAATALVRRVVPGHASQFAVEEISPNSIDKDAFEVESVDGKIILRGSNAVCIASAL